MSRLICGTTPPTSIAALRTVALIDVAHWASEFPWCEQAADVLRSSFGAALPVRVCSIRTDPWNVEHVGDEIRGEQS